MPQSVTYTAVLDMRQETVLFASSLLHAERRRRGTRRGRRALGCFAQAVLVLRWFLDGTRIKQLACDNGIAVMTTYPYLHEGIDALAKQAPDLHEVLEKAKSAGLSHVNLDGVVIPTDRVAAPERPRVSLARVGYPSHRHSACWASTAGGSTPSAARISATLASSSRLTAAISGRP